MGNGDDGFVVKGDDLNLVFSALDLTDYTPEHRAYVLLSALIGLLKVMGNDRSVLLDAVNKNWDTIPAPEVIKEH